MATGDEDTERWYRRGRVLCTTGCFNDAVVCYDEALESSPDDPVLWRRKGFVLIKAGRYGEAAACFDKALSLDPEDATAWQRKGYALAHLGDHEGAVACCDKALSLDREHVLAWQSRGWVLGLICRYDEAVECYETVLSIDPERESAAWHRDRMQERRDLAALEAEIREAGRVVEVPACVADVVRERDYGNVDLARAVLRELARRAEKSAAPRS
jgi:tetratricopeptide (TPR) repeat protein